MSELQLPKFHTFKIHVIITRLTLVNVKHIFYCYTFRLSTWHGYPIYILAICEILRNIKKKSWHWKPYSQMYNALNYTQQHQILHKAFDGTETKWVNNFGQLLITYKTLTVHVDWRLPALSIALHHKLTLTVIKNWQWKSAVWILTTHCRVCYQPPSFSQCHSPTSHAICICSSRQLNECMQ